MYIYINSFDYDRIVFEDLDIFDVQNEDLFVTKNGIYKLYKQHFYKMNFEDNIYDTIRLKHIDVLVQKYDTKIVKENPRTSFPINCHVIHRKVYKTIVGDNILMVKTIDNDVFESYHYELTNEIPLEDAIEHIGLFLYENIKS